MLGKQGNIRKENRQCKRSVCATNYFARNPAFAGFRVSTSLCAVNIKLNAYYSRARTMAAASAASFSMAAQLLAASASFGTTHVPPQQTISGTAR